MFPIDELLSNFDQKVRDQGFSLVAGADESGRGALAGPLVAAAVILPNQSLIKDLKDSKKVTATKRQELYEIITNVAVSWKVVRIEAKEIDRSGLQKANILALEGALRGLSPQPNYILTDKYEAASLKIPHLGVVKGDSVSASIAAASILAKVTRDKIMTVYHKQYPQYHFDLHKGYGTKAHLQALKRWGPSPIHRHSFSQVKDL
jgi:ribonuclease HII